MSFTNVHNYYEKLVYDEVLVQNSQLVEPLPNDSLEDAACLALNKLPPRYVRFEVDTAFFLSPEERSAISSEINRVVAEAIGFVRTNPNPASA